MYIYINRKKHRLLYRCFLSFYHNLLHNSHAEYALYCAEFLHDIIIRFRLHIQHRISHLAAGLICHIGDIDACITQNGCKFRDHIGNIFMEQRNTSLFGADAHIAVRIIDGIDDITVFQIISQLLYSHFGTVILDRKSVV